VWSRNRAHAQRFVERERARYAFPISVAEDPEHALGDADIVCTVTAAREPILHGRQLATGCHVNAVGSCTPTTRELDAEAVARARLFVDRRESTLAEAGDFLLARAEGAVDDSHIVAELGDILIGRDPGRRTDEEITLFESLGIGMLDLVAAHHLHRVARERGLGIPVSLGGTRD
jgi:ornithine cyclodeaminase